LKKLYVKGDKSFVEDYIKILSTELNDKIIILGNKIKTQEEVIYSNI